MNVWKDEQDYILDRNTESVFAKVENNKIVGLTEDDIKILEQHPTRVIWHKNVKNREEFPSEEEINNLIKENMIKEDETEPIKEAEEPLKEEKKEKEDSKEEEESEPEGNDDGDVVQTSKSEPKDTVERVEEEVKEIIENKDVSKEDFLKIVSATKDKKISATDIKLLSKETGLTVEKTLYIMQHFNAISNTYPDIMASKSINKPKSLGGERAGAVIKGKLLPQSKINNNYIFL